MVQVRNLTQSSFLKNFGTFYTWFLFCKILISHVRNLSWKVRKKNSWVYVVFYSNQFFYFVFFFFILFIDWLSENSKVWWLSFDTKNTQRYVKIILCFLKFHLFLSVCIITPSDWILAEPTPLARFFLVGDKCFNLGNLTVR